jgi:hypothetical protein
MGIDYKNKYLLKRHILITQLLLFILTFFTYGQNAEKQKSFALENKPHEYYVKQAGLWWKETEKNKYDENSWYNYFRSCRNAQATANWSEEFVKESPYLKLGPEIVNLIQNAIPNSFTYNFVVWEERGFDPAKGSYLLKAYEMNPDFEGIHSSMVTYTETELNFDLRKKVNQKWFTRNEISPGLLAYGYNVLMSLEPNSIILTQHDNDSYPLWMLQDVKNIRTDVTVINFDLLLVKNYRDKIFNKYNIPLLDKEFEESNSLNHKILIEHILKYYNYINPLYLGLTVTPEYYENYHNNLFLTGLALKYSNLPVDTFSICDKHYKNDFLLDYLNIQYTNDKNQNSVNYQNLNYLKSFKILYKVYKSKDFNKARKIRGLAKLIAENSGNKKLIDQVNIDFK